MGGGAKQNDPGVAQQQSAAAQQSEAANAKLTTLNTQEQQALFNGLFGTPGTPGFGKDGTLSKMMDPQTLLNSGKALQGPYSQAWNTTQDQIGKNYANQRGQLRQQMANQGFTAGMPSGFEQQQEANLSRGEADTRGSTYTGLLGAGYQDAINNFWNSHNIASGQAAGARSGALSGAAGEGSTASSMYGTAGAFHQDPSTLGAIMQGAGTAGAGALSNPMLFCPARGAKITLVNGARKPVEFLRKGDIILQKGGKGFKLPTDPVAVPQQLCEVITKGHKHARVSMSHTFATDDGGYQYAGKCGMQMLDSVTGPDEVVRIISKDEGGLELHDLVYPLDIGGNHTYLVDDLWSLA